MSTRELFLRVLATCPMEEAAFLLLLGDTVRSLLALYPTPLLSRAGNAAIGAPTTLDEETGLHPLYDGALVAGVIARKTKDPADNAAFHSEAEGAFRSAWREAAARRRAFLKEVR